MAIRNDAHRDEFHRDQQWHKPVRVATTANITISTALNAGDTIDGVTLAAGDRVLVKNQSTGLQNGIYEAGATPARAYDMLVGIQARGAFVYVIAGTANGGKLFYNTNTTLPTIDTDALTFSQFTGSGADLSAIDFLTATSHAELSAEIVVGTTPGGELGGSWGTPTVDDTHAGSNHHGVYMSLTNKSGGSVAAGDVVISDGSNDGAFTTTTTGRYEGSVGIAQATIANNATGLVLVAGYAALVNVPASVTRGHYVETHTVAKQATGSSSRRSGSFGQFLTGGTSPTAWLWGQTDQSASAGGGVATDAIWDAKGDLAVGTGADTAQKLTVGANDTIPMADSAQTVGIKWVGSQTPSTQDYSDVAAEGTADTYARGDHKHGMPADPGASGGSVGADGFYGDGSDGDVTIAVNTTITRDMHYHNLTVNTGIVLNPDQYRIFVSGTLTLTGKIKKDGNAGGNAGNGTAAAGGAAGTAGVAISGNNIGTGAAGLIGKVGGFNANGINGTNSTQSTWNVAHSASAAGGDSGTGRTGGTGIAAAGDNTMNDKPATWPGIIQLRDRTGNAVAMTNILGIAPSAGSGAGSAASGGGGSGGSGSGGGAVIVCARVITGVGNMEAVGGAGGNGGNGGGTNAGGGGGGSGGAGGVVVLIYKDSTGWSGSLVATGGAGGAAGTGIGSGVNGGGGTNGPTGKTFLFKMG